MTMSEVSPEANRLLNFCRSEEGQQIAKFLRERDRFIEFGEYTDEQGTWSYGYGARTLERHPIRPQKPEVVLRGMESQKFVELLAKSGTGDVVATAIARIRREHAAMQPPKPQSHKWYYIGMGLFIAVLIILVALGLIHRPPVAH